MLYRVFICLILVFVLTPRAAHARVVTDVRVAETEDGYEVEIEFLFPVRYISHSPEGPSRELRVQLKPVNFQQLTEDQVEDLRERISLSWDTSAGAPLEDITIEGGDPEQPQVDILFTKPVVYEVRGGADLRSLVIKILREEEAAVREPLPEVEAPEWFTPDDEALARRLNAAKKYVSRGKYVHAARVFYKLQDVAQGEDRRRVREWLGWAREQAGQYTLAKLDYGEYILAYFRDPSAERVRLRLKRASMLEEQWLAEARKRVQRWKANYYGNVSEFYSRDQTTLQGSDTKVNRSEFVTGVNLNGRWHSQRYDVRSQASWEYLESVLSGTRDQDTLNVLTLEGRDSKYGLFGKAGRQWLGRAGVYDTFDGAQTSYAINKQLKVNSVFGFPVADASQKEIDPGRKFYGASLDLGRYKERWEFMAFFLRQENRGFTDRQAVGGEVSYAQDNFGLYTSADYDTHFDRLNIFTVNGWWVLPSKTVLSMVYDHRMSPSLTTNNAIIGQGVTELTDLQGRFSDSAIKRLAMDRTSISKTLSMSASKQVKKDMKVTGDVTVFDFEGQPTSGGVQGFRGTGFEYFYTLQLVTNNTFLPNDVVISGLRVSDKNTYYAYALSFSTQLPLNIRLRLIPELSFEYQDVKGTSANRLKQRSTARADYRLSKIWRFEAEAGSEWLGDRIGGDSSSTNLFLTAGATMSF